MNVQPKALVRRCPICGSDQPVSEPLCTQCLFDLTGVEIREEGLPIRRPHRSAARRRRDGVSTAT